jgi:uncharacterized protein Veg
MREDSLKWHEGKKFLAINFGGERKEKEKKKGKLKDEYWNNLKKFILKNGENPFSFQTTYFL